MKIEIYQGPSAPGMNEHCTHCGGTLASGAPVIAQFGGLLCSLGCVEASYPGAVAAYIAERAELEERLERLAMPDPYTVRHLFPNEAPPQSLADLEHKICELGISAQETEAALVSIDSESMEDQLSDPERNEERERLNAELEAIGDKLAVLRGALAFNKWGEIARADAARMESNPPTEPAKRLPALTWKKIEC